jgi:hypothetical protein
MRLRNGAVLVAALALVVGGCAKPRPCVIIPRQLELARYEADQLDKLVTAKAGEVSSLQGNLDMANTRLAQLQQESADLDKVIAAAKADSAAAGRKK